MLFPLVALLLGAVPIAIESAGCPNREELAAALEPLLPAGVSGVAPTETAVVERLGDRVRLTLRRWDGAVIGERELPASEGCANLTSAVAVVLASWWTDVHPEYVVRAPPGTQVVAASPPAAPRSTVLELSAGGGAGLADGDWAPEASVSFMVAPGDGFFGVRVKGLFSGTRVVGLGMGTARWSRWPLILGPTLRLKREAWRAELFAGAAVAWLSAAGQGFPENRQTDAVAFGAHLAARMSGRGKFAPFVEIAASAWPRRERVLENVGTGAARLPRGELGLTAGIALGQ